jgi:hypothetical protein
MVRKKMTKRDVWEGKKTGRGGLIMSRVKCFFGLQKQQRLLPSLVSYSCVMRRKQASNPEEWITGSPNF